MKGVAKLALGIINVFLSDFDIVVLTEVWNKVILWAWWWWGLERCLHDMA